MEPLPAYCRRDGADLLLDLRVVPRAARTDACGARHGRLLVRLTAPPADGKANAELARYLAKAAGVNRTAVGIESGERCRDKRIRLAGLDRLPPTLRTESE